MNPALAVVLSNPAIWRGGDCAPEPAALPSGFPALDARFSVWKRLLVGFAEEVEIDAAWRVLISPELRKFASLEKSVMLVGQGSHFEIWNQDALENELQQLRSQAEVPPGMEDFAL